MSDAVRRNLTIANDRRLTRAAVRREVWRMPADEAWLRLAELVEDRPEWLLSQEVFGLLKWVRRYGQLYARSVWRRCGFGAECPPDKRVEELTDRQRGVLVAELRQRAAAARG